MNESKSIRLEGADGLYLSRIVRADKAAYLEHFADPEIAQNLLAIPFRYTEADAIRTFSDHAFQQLRIHRLFATAFSSNLASHRALEKAGFQREGLLRHHHFKGGIYLDAVIYGRISDSN